MADAKKEKKKKVMISLREEVHSRLKAVSRFEGRHMTWIIAQLIDDHTKRAIKKNPDIIKDKNDESHDMDQR